MNGPGRARTCDPRIMSLALHGLTCLLAQRTTRLFLRMSGSRALRVEFGLANRHAYWFAGPDPRTDCADHLIRTRSNRFAILVTLVPGPFEFERAARSAIRLSDSGAGIEPWSRSTCVLHACSRACGWRPAAPLD